MTDKTKDVSAASSGPLCFRNISDEDDFEIIVNAMVTNPSQAAEITDLIESVFSIPSRLISDEGKRLYEEEVKKSETIEGKLGWAVETYRQEIDGGWEGRLKGAGSKSELRAKLRSIATTHYWTSVENNLSLLMQYIEALGTDDVEDSLKKWRSMLWNKAKEAYQVACGKETPRQMRAFAKGWQVLTGKKDEKTETKEEAHAVS